MARASSSRSPPTTAAAFTTSSPPGQSGFAGATDLAQFEATCPPGGSTNCPNARRPPHSADQLGMYGDLFYASPGLTAADIGKYFKDATFGVKDGDVERAYQPRDDVTVLRDKGFGVPHVYGRTRAARCSPSATSAPRTACS